jgi:hypothetical protein
LQFPETGFLETVGGSVVIENNGITSCSGLDWLNLVGGSMTVGSNAQLGEIAFPKLREVSDGLVCTTMPSREV